MIGQTEIKTNEIWGKLSLLCVLTSVMLCVAGFSTAFALKIEILLWSALIISFFLVTLGLLSGIVGLFTKRAWVGLVTESEYLNISAHT